MFRMWIKRSNRAVAKLSHASATAECLEQRSLLSVTTLSAPSASSIVIGGESGGTAYTVSAPGNLKIADDAPQNGEEIPGSGNGAAGYQIQVIFPDSSLTASQKAVFTTAAARWQQIILAELPDV